MAPYKDYNQEDLDQMSLDWARYLMRTVWTNLYWATVWTIIIRCCLKWVSTCKENIVIKSPKNMRIRFVIPLECQCGYCGRCSKAGYPQEWSPLFVRRLTQNSKLAFHNDYMFTLPALQ
mgnify:CR=1 FL=1